MASRFVLTAQIQLQAPTNGPQVVNQINQQLQGVNVPINLTGGRQASRQVNNLNQATQQAATAADRMGKAFGASIRRFGAFTIATRAVSLFTNSLANATKEAIDFEREMIKISQVTGKTMAQLKGLENIITELSTSLGVSSKSVLSVGRILSQAGIQAGDLEVALKALAKTELAPTFDDITQTAEGAVAILAQFGEGVGALERQLGAINAVAGQFAVESGDLISAVRRTGGVFKAAGGELEELIALFTSVRATTRESAESIATGLRTIFTRIQRPETIDFLKQFGVQLTDLNGRFVGPYEAIKQLSAALSGLGEGDIRFVQIAEELGGFRQIGKVIPLLQQFETAERARQAAIEGGNSLDKDAAQAQAALAVQIAKVKEEFLALVRGLTQTTSFQLMVKTSLELASALIKVAEALKPVIPLLAAFGAIKFARGAAGFARGIGAGLRGAPQGFASGGMVPGTGNRDTVPAMLTPGEFVIRKSSVSKLGTGTLAAMNQNGYAAGGKIDGVQYLNPGGRATPGVRRELVNLQKTGQMSTAAGTTAKDGDKRAIKIIEKEFLQEGDPDTYGAAFLRPFGAKTVAKGTNDSGRIATELSKTKELGFLKVKLNKSGFSEAGNGLKQLLGQIANKYSKKNTFELSTGSLPKSEAEALEDVVLGGVEATIREGANKLGGTLGMTTPVEVAKALKSANIDQVSGNIFEAILGFAGSPYSEKDGDAANAPFDFNAGLGATIAKKFGLSKVASRPTEAKSYFSEGNVSSIAKKVENYNIAEARADFQRAYLDMIPQLEALGVGALKGRGFGDTGAKQQERIASLRNRRSPLKLASGGGISGSDTVPAMLTPGEFVFNKKAAQSIGYSNLSRMNTKGVQGFNKGGPVGGVQYFEDGGRANLQTRRDRIVAGQSKIKNIIDTGKTASGAPQGDRQIANAIQRFNELEKELVKVDRELEKLDKQAKQRTQSEKEATVVTKEKTTADKASRTVSPSLGFKPPSASAMISGAASVSAGGGQLAPITAKSAAQASPAVQNLVKNINAASNATNQNTQASYKSKTFKVQLQRAEIKFTNAIKRADATIQGQFDKGLKQTGKDLLNLGKQGAGGLMGKLKELGTSVKQAGANLKNLGRGTPQMLGGVPISPRLDSALKKQPKLPKAPRTGGMGGMDSGMGMGLMMAATSMAAMIPEVEGATDGFGGVQNALGETIMTVSTFGFLLSSLPLGKVGGAMAAAAVATFAAAKMIDAYTGVHEKAKKAVEEGNVEEAGSTAVKSANAGLANKAAAGVGAVSAGIGTLIGGVLGSIGGPLGTALGGALGGVLGTVVGTLAGIVTKIVLSMEMLEPALNWFRDNILTLFGADSTAMVAQRAKLDAALNRETKQLAESAKSASEELKKVESGEQSIEDAFKTGNLTKGFGAVQAANQVRLETVAMENEQNVSRAGEGNAAATALGLSTSYVGAGIMAAQAISGQEVTGPTEIGDSIGAYIGLWDSASVRTEKALKEATEAEKKAKEENNKKLAEQLNDPQFKKAFGSLAKSVTGTAAAFGSNLAEQDPSAILDEVLKGMGPEAEAQVRAALEVNPKLKEEFETQVKNMAVAAKENAEFLKSLNFGLKDVVSGISTFNNSLNSIAATAETGYNSLAVATNTLAASISGAGATINSADLNAAISEVSDSFAAFGATKDQIAGIEGTLSGFNQAQKNANAALNSLKTGLTGKDLSNDKTLSAVQGDFKAALLDTIPDDSPMKARLTSAFNNIGDLTQEEIEQFYNTGDAGPILERAFGPLGEEIQKQIIGPSEEMAKANAQLIKATQARREAELRLIDVQKKAIDVQIDAAKNLEFFGGAKFTPEKEFEARRQQTNLTLQDAGISGLTTGSAEDIRRASAEVFNKFSGQQQAQNAAVEGSGGRRGAFADRAGVETDRRPELQKANEELIEITKRGIEQRKQELELIQKKNKAEKDALDSLLGGNIEEFFDKSSAAAAGSALRSGNAAAAGLFSASSLGAGLQSLQGTGLSDAENKRASQLTFGALGLGDRASSIFSGTTSEEERIKAEGRELSQLQGELGGQMADMEKMNVQAKQVIINTQDAKFNEMQQSVQQNQAQLGLYSKGGPVYASRGMFIPRGTDTIPAMLTPGEFVVNRAAVQRGNNLQVLRAMNGGGGNGSTNSAGVPTMNRGGGVFGRRGDMPTMPDLAPVFDKFSEAVDKLAGLNISVKLETANVNVNFNGTSFLSNLNEEIRKVVLEESAKATRGLALSQNGEIKSGNTSVLGTA